MNIGLYICGVGQLPLIAIGIGILYALHPDSSTTNNNWALSVSVAWTFRLLDRLGHPLVCP